MTKTVVLFPQPRKKSAMIFTERDQKITHDLEMVPFMTRSQICALHFHGTSDAPFITRMNSLVSSGKVHKFTLPFATGGRPEYGYSRKLPPNYVIQPHMADISWTYVSFKLATLTSGFTIDEWTRPTKRNAAGLIPDAVFTITTDKRPYRFLLEVDKGTESLISSREHNDLKSKIEKYELYI
jgi:hypothetical protein